MIKQTLALAAYKATVAEYQIRCSELHRSGWVANQGETAEFLIFIQVICYFSCSLPYDLSPIYWEHKFHCCGLFIYLFKVYFGSREETAERWNRTEISLTFMFSTHVWISRAVSRNQPAKRPCSTYSVGQPPLTCFLHDSWLFPWYK